MKEMEKLGISWKDWSNSYNLWCWFTFIIFFKPPPTLIIFNSFFLFLKLIKKNVIPSFKGNHLSSLLQLKKCDLN